MGNSAALRLALAGTTGLLLSGLLGCQSTDLQGAKAEVSETNVALDLPAVPEFQKPSPNPDGTHSVAEMRLEGNKFLDTDVKVKGYILWVYDCATVIRTPEMTDKEVQRILTDEPERCLRPHLVIGDEATTPVDRGIEVVEYPRPLRRDEKRALPDEMVAEMQAALEGLPPFKVGDQVAITGKWALQSPGGFRNSEGLLVYQAMENLSQADAGE